MSIIGTTGGFTIVKETLRSNEFFRYKISDYLSVRILVIDRFSSSECLCLLCSSLFNDNIYIPYIRLTYVFQILHHPMYKKESINVKNLPVVGMTSVERVYYKQLSSFSIESDWINEQLLSVSILDGIIAIVNLTRNFNEENFVPSDERCKEWRDALNRIRQEARNRWILDEKCVLQRIHNQQSTCIISNTLAKRRSHFEERVNKNDV